MIKFLCVVILSCLAAYLYRMGGDKRYNTKVRDLGCPAVMVLTMFVLGYFHWNLIICFGLLFGAMTTYWKRGTTAYWYNWLFTGLGYSFAMLPVLFITHNYVGFMARTLICSSAIMAWSENIGSDVWEERGRGFINNVTLPLLFIA